MTCACGTPIGPLAKRCARCRGRLAQARYARTAKGRATQDRYLGSDRYRATNERVNRRRLFVAGDCVGRVESAERAALINAHIKERRLAFIKGQQDREKTEGPAASGISTETAI